MNMKYRNRYASDEMFTASDGRDYRVEEVLEGIYDNARIYAAKNGRNFERGDMDDITQDCAVKFWTSRGHYDPSKGASLHTYGERIATNRERDAYMAEMRRNAHFSSIEDFEENDGRLWEYDTTTTGSSDEFRADFGVRSSEAWEYIQEKINGLNDRYRAVINLLIEGYGSDDIAERYGWDAGKAYRIVCRARKALAMSLGHDYLAENGFGRL